MMLGKKGGWGGGLLNCAFQNHIVSSNYVYLVYKTEGRVIEREQIGMKYLYYILIREHTIIYFNPKIISANFLSKHMSRPLI